MNTLAIVSAIGSLGIGALVGALVTHLLSERRDRRVQKRERRGLVRLIDYEITLNDQAREKLSAFPDYLNKGGLFAFRTEAWAASMVRLAELLPEEDFKLVAKYYNALITMLDEVHDHQRRQETSADAITNYHIEGLRLAWYDADEALGKYRVPEADTHKG